MVGVELQRIARAFFCNMLCHSDRLPHALSCQLKKISLLMLEELEQSSFY